MSQCDAILGFLRSGYPLTALEALKRFGCLRLAARIGELRERGHVIESREVRVSGKAVAEYRMQAGR